MRDGKVELARLALPELFRRARGAMLNSVNARTKDVLTEALLLPIDERAALAHELLASLDGEADADVEESWTTEIQRRLSAARRGEGKGPEVHSTIAELRERLRRDG